MTNLERYVEQLKRPAPQTADICEHLDTLTSYARKCEHITEMGFRTGTSFAALLAAQPKQLITYDLYIPKTFKEQLQILAGNTAVTFVENSTLTVEIEETDFLFIDTLHTYNQLKLELELHGNKARKFLGFHDTVTFGRSGEDGDSLGLLDAIEEFQAANSHWAFDAHFENNNGLTILRREPCN